MEDGLLWFVDFRPQTSRLPSFQRRQWSTHCVFRNFTLDRQSHRNFVTGIRCRYSTISLNRCATLAAELWLSRDHYFKAAILRASGYCSGLPPGALHRDTAISVNKVFNRCRYQSRDSEILVAPCCGKRHVNNLPATDNSLSTVQPVINPMLSVQFWTLTTTPNSSCITIYLCGCFIPVLPVLKVVLLFLALLDISFAVPSFVASLRQRLFPFRNARSMLLRLTRQLSGILLTRANTAYFVDGNSNVVS